MSHIERRRNLWYAVLVVPADLREQLGKYKFIQSLRTSDKREAHALAAPVVAAWRAIIRRERGEGDALATEALRWRAALARMPTDNAGEIEAVQGVVIERAERIEGERDYKVAKRFADIAFGSTDPSGMHFEPWLAQLDLAKKTADQMRKDVAALVLRFPTLRDITHQSVKGWLDELSDKLISTSSQARITSFCRSYWRYLQSIDAVPSDSMPFSMHGGIRSRKSKSSGGSWEPLRAQEVIKLWEGALARGDTTLADLIIIGAYTGARIEELCALKAANVEKTSFTIKDSKTIAGLREVPIHSRIRQLVARLKASSSDGYLISGLTFNKYGGRSNAIGKRFGRLKEAQGFGAKHVFHSIRKTLVTLLENAGVSENLAADIVGHEKPRITYGLYSGGANLDVKAAAIELIDYPVGTGAIT